MNSPKTLTKVPIPNGELTVRLKQLGLSVTSEGLDDLLARASTQRWSPRQLLEEVTRAEAEDRARRSLERRLAQARLGRFKPMADFEWHWPKKIDRALLERALSLDFLSPGCNLILCGSNGVGK
ncbi:MAG TPA: ATP-binding protein, partial [Candidatus Angelobacter sp.]|nr:ATP-binding protein [Candidatus Angelobacter sp.]